MGMTETNATPLTTPQAPEPIEGPQTVTATGYHGAVGTGGSDPQVVEYDNESLCVVKFQQNKQGPWVLANETFITQLGRWIACLDKDIPLLPMPEPLLVKVTDDVLGNDNLEYKQTDGTTAPPQTGLHFGSSLVGSPDETSAKPSIEAIHDACNLDGLIGTIALDLVVGNYDRDNKHIVLTTTPTGTKAWSVDNGHAFDKGNAWENLDITDDQPARQLASRTSELVQPLDIEARLPGVSDTMSTAIGRAPISDMLATIPYDEWGLAQAQAPEVAAYVAGRAARLRELAEVYLDHL